MKDIRLTYRSLGLMAAAVLMAGCNDTDTPVADEPVDEAVAFSGEMRKTDGASRADADGDEWLDMSFDTWKWNNSDVPVDFFIHQNVVTDNGSLAETAVYRLKPGETNRLICVDGQTPLNWQTKIARHKFYAWTQPDGVVMDASPVSGTVDMSKRNLDYEYFVGSTTDELSYDKHGLTVALKFEHLVSKLIIDRITLRYSDGIMTENLWDRVGSIYFPNMPTKGEFKTGVDGSDMAVTVVDDNKGILFGLYGNDDYSQCISNKYISLYVMPMLFDDGNDYGEFQVNLWHPDGDFRRYTGNLKDLVNVDDPDNTLGGIKAGECLTVQLVLNDATVRGFYSYVERWSDEDPQKVKDTPYPGISTPQDLKDNTKLLSGTIYELAPDDDVIYGTTDDGKKIVRIYDNLDLSVFLGGVTKIIIPDGYVLDGLGHNISGIPGLVIVGDVRNLYINDVEC